MNLDIPREGIDPSVGRESSTHASRAVGLAAAVTVLAVVGVLAVWPVMWAAQRRLTPVPPPVEPLEVKAGPPMEADIYESGKELFAASCVSCHGPTGQGMPGAGKSLLRSKFIASADDDPLIEFLKRGRPSSDPLNTTKVDMPPKGGNPALSEDDLWDIVQFLRVLQDPSRAPKQGAAIGG